MILLMQVDAAPAQPAKDTPPAPMPAEDASEEEAEVSNHLHIILNIINLCYYYCVLTNSTSLPAKATKLKGDEVILLLLSIPGLPKHSIHIFSVTALKGYSSNYSNYCTFVK
ncbi:hypothetical protein PAMP_021103 [Pampus punctatissimus]